MPDIRQSLPFSRQGPRPAGRAAMKLSQTNSKSTPGRGEDGHAPDRSVALHDKRVKRALVEGVVVSDLASQRHENRTEEDDYEGLVLTDQVGPSARL